MADRSMLHVARLAVRRLTSTLAFALATSAMLACAGSSRQPSEPQAVAPAAADSDTTHSWRRTAPRPGSPLEFEYPVPELTQLDNGVTLYVVPQRKPIVSAALVLSRGSAADPPGQSGLAALTARMLTEETSELSPRELAATIEDFGSEMLVHTLHDSTSLTFRFLAEDLQAGIGLMSQVFTDSSFSANAFERVQREWLDLLRRQRQDPAALASIVGLRASLPGRLGEPTAGSASAVRALTVEDLSTFHRSHYRPDASLLVVAGASMPEVKRAAAATLGTWTNPNKAPPKNPGAAHRPAESQLESQLEGQLEGQPEPALRSGAFKEAWIADRPGAAQSALFVSIPLPRRLAPGFEARELLNQVLGGMFTSRINQNLREDKGYTYGAFSSNHATQNFGLWALRTSVRTDVTIPALKEVLGELTRVAETEPITQSELSRARKELLGGHAASLERDSQMVDDLSDTFVYGLAPDYLNQLPEKLDGVTLDEVHAQAQQFFERRAPLVVIVGDRAKLQAELVEVAPNIAEAPPELLD